jgi:hypothetical protein
MKTIERPFQRHEEHPVIEATRLHCGLGNRFRVQVVDKGRVVHERGWQPNLILDQGMDNVATLAFCNLFLVCVAGTGNTPTEDDSGATTATTSGTTCTSSAGFFAPGDVGKLLRFDTGQKATITAYTSATQVTLSATLGVGAGTAFTLYRVTQTGLATESMRTSTYLTTSGACFNSRSGSTITSQRTYDFNPFSIAATANTGTDLITATNHGLAANDAVVLSGGTAPSPLVLGTTYYARDIAGNDFKLSATPGGAAIDLTTAGSGFSVQLPRNFAEVGFSNSATVANNLNMRALFAGGAVTVLAGQQLRIIYQFQVTLSPTTPQAKTFNITGWPSLEQTVTPDETTDIFTLTAHGFTANMPLSFVGTTAPTGLTFGTTYYARDITTNTFKVSATPGGAAINFTTNGTNVKVKTHTEGDEQLEKVHITAVNTSGGTGTFDSASYFSAYTNEPAHGTAGNGSFLVYLSTDGTLLGFPQTAQNYAPGYMASKSGSVDSYTAGTFTRTKRVTFAVADSVSAAIRGFGYTGANDGGGQVWLGGYRAVFDQKQDKNNVSTLTLVFRWTWDRVFS